MSSSRCAWVAGRGSAERSTRGEPLIGVAAAQFGVGSYGEVALVACSQSAVTVQDR